MKDKDFRLLMESLDRIVEDTNRILCGERTADGITPFYVDQEKTFKIMKALSEQGADEASAWGGFIYDFVPDDEDFYVEEDEIRNARFISLGNAMAAYNSVKDDDAEGYDSPAEEAYMSLMYGN